MAMGGSHKVINSGNRGRPYGLMLLLAFGAALLGVMVLHKLRERRIFNLLVKEKDNELISLQLLLQKEREYKKEMKRKTEEMKAKIYTLRAQKMELDRRLLEKQSTIDSLKDEQKAMESALEEKQNEIKMRKEEEIDSSEKISRLTALKETLKQKEAELEDLRHRLANPVEVQTASSNDQLNLHVNLKAAANMEEKDKTDFRNSKENGRELSQSRNLMDGENSTIVENGSEKRVEVTNSREMTVEISQEEGFKNGVVRETDDEGQVEKNKYFQEEGGAGIGEGKNIADSTEAIVDASENVSKLVDKDGNEHGSGAINKHWEPGKPENSQDENQEVQGISKGGKKLETLDSRIDAGSRLRGKHGQVGRTKGKRWRMIAKSRDLDQNGLASMKSRRFYGRHRDELRSRTESQSSNEGKGKGEGRAIKENPQEVRNAQNLEDAEYLKSRDVNLDPNQQVERENEMSKKSHDSPDNELQRNTNPNGEISSYAEKQKMDELRQPYEDEAGGNGIQQNLTSRANDEQSIGKEANEGNKRVLSNEMEVSDMQEPETESTDNDSSGASTSNLEADKEEYKEEIDESEF